MKTGKPKKMPFAPAGKGKGAPAGKSVPPWMKGKEAAGGAKPAFKKGGKVKC